MGEEVFVVLIVFGSIVSILLGWLVLRFKERVETQQTIRLALEKGNELTPEILRQLNESEPDQNKDLRRAVIWLAVAGALVLAAFAVPEPEALRGMLTGAAFPFCIGAAYLVLYRFSATRTS